MSALAPPRDRRVRACGQRVNALAFRQWRGAPRVAAEKHPSNLIRVMPAEGMPGQGGLAPATRIPRFVGLPLIRSP